jgi:hypothetical protein
VTLATVTLATVTQASPLQVRVDGAATATPARGVSGYAPALNARVLVALVGRIIYVFGAA